MQDRDSRRERRPARWFAPAGDGLEKRRTLSASALGHHLGAYLAPGTGVVRPSSPPQLVNPRTGVNDFLAGQLGPDLTTVQGQIQARGSSSQNSLATAVVANPFINAVLRSQDTYTLLGSATSAANSNQAPLIVSGPATAIVVSVPQQAQIVALGPDTSTIQVLPTSTAVGYFVQVPTTNIQTYPPGSTVTATVQIPVSSVPPNVPVTLPPAPPSGTLSGVYADTSPLLVDALQTATARPAPNTPRSVPGLRLAGALQHNRNFPIASAPALLRAFHVAVTRQVFTLTQAQQTAVSNGFGAFQGTVATLAQAGAFTPATPPAPPALTTGPLNGTLEVSLGALRNLADVQSSLTGLQLPNIANFPGRLDVGYVFDRAGDFGLLLTARGALAGAPTGVASANVLAGDIQVEVSNAPNLAALGGQRVVEGLSQGTGLSAGVSSSSNASGVSTFGASVGYGSGLEFGTGAAYSQVIPLGNVYALIPSAPK
jgi:hypothetical protein